MTTGAAPAVASGWQAGSQTEPNTAYDTTEYMWPDANQDPVEKVYFNGFIVNGWDFVGNVDPTIGGGSEVSHLVQFAAYLGFWRDCNKDGYIGAKAHSSIYESHYGHFSTGAYPSAIEQADPAVCGSAPYNHGSIIDEFRWIGPNATPEEDLGGCDPTQTGDLVNYTENQLPGNNDPGCFMFSNDPYDVNDKDAVVWFDWNAPAAQAASTRPVFSKEMYDDSSSTLEIIGFFGFHNLVEGEQNVPVVGPVTVVPEGTWDNKPTVGKCDDGDKTFMGGPGLLNEDDHGVTVDQGTCGLYPLWQAERIVNDSDSENEDASPVVQVYDTSDDRDGSGSACDDTTLPGGFYMADVSPDVHANFLMEGSIGGTTMNVLDGAGFSYDEDDDGMPVVKAGNGQCGEGNEPMSLAGSQSQKTADGKFAVDTFLEFETGSRLRALEAQGHTSVPVDAGGLTAGPAAPAGWYHDETRWMSFHVYIWSGAHNTLRDGRHTTMYADVTQEAFDNAGNGASPESSLPSGVDNKHEYGKLECNGNYDDTAQNRQPNAYGWICSAAVWQEEADSLNTRLNRTAVKVIIGHAFDLRDVDCYDGTLLKDAETGDVIVTTPSGDQISVRDSCGEFGLLNPAP